MISAQIVATQLVKMQKQGLHQWVIGSMPLWYLIQQQITNRHLFKLECVPFPFSPPDETDGPPGAIAMATMLLSLGKQVTMVTDRRAFEMNQALINEAVRTGGEEVNLNTETISLSFISASNVCVCNSTLRCAENCNPIGHF